MRTLGLLVLAAGLPLVAACDRRCGTVTVEGVNVGVYNHDDDKTFPIDGAYLLQCGDGWSAPGTPDHWINLWPDGYGFDTRPAAQFFLWTWKRNRRADQAVGRLPRTSLYADVARVNEGAILTPGDGLIAGESWLFEIKTMPWAFELPDGTRTAGELNHEVALEDGALEILEVRELRGCDEPRVEVRVHAAYEARFVSLLADAQITVEAEGETWFQFAGSTTPGLDEDVALYCARTAGFDR